MVGPRCVVRVGRVDCPPGFRPGFSAGFTAGVSACRARYNLEKSARPSPFLPVCLRYAAIRFRIDSGNSSTTSLPSLFWSSRLKARLGSRVLLVVLLGGVLLVRAERLRVGRFLRLITRKPGAQVAMVNRPRHG